MQFLAARSNQSTSNSSLASHPRLTDRFARTMSTRIASTVVTTAPMTVAA